MRWIVLGIASWLCLPSSVPLAGQTESLPYEDRYRDNLLYLHALAGYEFDLLEDFQWERRRVAGNGLRLSYGSVDTKDLLTDVELRINQPLGGGWWFLGQLRDYSSLHLPLRRQEFWTGFERTVSGGFSAFFRLAPLPDKELMDGEAGLSLSSADREHYLRLALQWEDFNYDLKNDLDGVSRQTPMGLRWLLRTGRGGVWFTSDGTWGRGFSRRYDHPEKSPDLQGFDQEENEGRLRVYYEAQGPWMVELSGYLYRFSEAKSYRADDLGDYRYRNSLSWMGVRFALNPTAGHGARAGLKRVWQDADAEGFRSFVYDRREWLPSLVYTYTRGRHALETGYLGSFHAWDFDDRLGPDSYRTEDVTEKLKLGYTFSFKETGTLNLSVSHVLSVWGFGGGAVRLNLPL